jgi:PHD/YefM family antitoxin component YafN of YafNO toxin-antitoxin module
MESFSAVDLSTRMGHVIDQAMAHPVQITRYRRAVVVMINAAEYERLTEAEAELKRLQEDTDS